MRTPAEAAAVAVPEGGPERPGRVRGLLDGLVRKAGGRSGSARTAGITMADQCFASVSNFAVGVAVARIAGVSGLGAFSFAYAAWIFMTTLHRSAITDPMAIVGDLRTEESREHLARGFAAEVALGIGATFVFALVGLLLVGAHLHSFGIAVLSLAPWITFLNLQDYWRWIGFLQGRPGKSLVNDAVFDVGQAGALALVVVTGHHSVFAVVSAWGVGAVAGAAYGLRQFSVRPRVRGGIQRLRSRWHLSKWLAASSATNWGGSQLALILPGLILGPAALGGLKAAWGLVTGPSGPIIQAGASFGLPEASKGLAERGWPGLRHVSRFVTIVSFLVIASISALVMLFGGTLLRWFYGAAFAQYVGAARILAAATMVGALTLGSLLALKAASQTRALFAVQAVTLVVSMPAALVLSELFGVDGAAWSSVVTIATTLVVVQLLRRRAERAGRVGLNPAPGQPAAEVPTRNDLALEVLALDDQRVDDPAVEDLAVQELAGQDRRTDGVVVGESAPPGGPRPTVILICFACGPGEAAEYGAGWSWALDAAQVADVILITDSSRRERIEETIAARALPIRVRWVDLTAPTRIALSLPARRRGRPGPGRLLGFVWYWMWMAKSARVVRSIEREQPIDAVHHVTFASDYLPSALLASRAPVRVWGPLAASADVGPALPARAGAAGWDTMGRRAARAAARAAARTAVRAAWGARLGRHATLIVARHPEVERRWRRAGSAVVVDPTSATSADDPVVSPLDDARPGWLCDWYARPAHGHRDPVEAGAGRSGL